MKPAGALEPGVAEVRSAFDQLAPDYDREWTESLIGRLQRQAVWNAIDRLVRPGDHVLDLGCGTGADAVHLAGQGALVHGIDVSPAMASEARRRIEEERLTDRVTVEALGIEGLHALAGYSFDGVLSNFGPLNCVADLRPAAGDLAKVVRPGGWLAICLMGRFCLWETLLYSLTGQPRKVVRRWRKESRASLAPVSHASLETESLPVDREDGPFSRVHPERLGPESGAQFDVYYPSMRDLMAAFGGDFQLKSVTGIGVLVPPSYMEPIAARFPRTVKALAMADRVAGGWPGFRSIGDHRLCVFVRKA